MRRALLALLAPAALSAQTDWPVYGGDPGAMKYSALADLNPGNVGRLTKLWEWSTGEAPMAQWKTRPGLFQATPLMIGDTLFLPTSYNQVAALNAATGREYWRFDPRAYEAGQAPNGTGFVHRGVASWSDGKTRRIFLNSRWRLIALDAATGRPIPSFGAGGEVDLAGDLVWQVNRRRYTNTSPPVVWGNLVIVGNGVADKFAYKNDPPGDIQAFDARTGKRIWKWSPIPQGGDGSETWENESWRFTGHTNVWAPFSVDVARGLVYLPVSTPSNDWYGGARKGDNLFAESLVCLDARTGEKLWHFQTVHHGLWDYDLPTAPVLGRVTQPGGPVDFVAMPTKMGMLFVFDRVTGTPLWPVEERPVPASDVLGERAAPTQPFPTKPAPYARQGFSATDVVDFTPALKELATRTVTSYRTGPLFTPPSLQGTVASPGLIGGSGWGGGAYDPETGIIYLKATNQPALLKLVTPPPSDSLDAAYALDFTASLDLNAKLLSSPDDPQRAAASLPISKPPYGTLTAIDLATGDHRWQVPLGDSPEIRNHPLLKGVALPPLGVAGAPGAIVTKGGLLFATGGGSALIALDKATGKVLWQAPLGAIGYANPMTYRTRAGQQVVVIATGGGAAPAKLQAFSLPR
ncbi:MAG: pyrroloquinoline quinone-dependent dehydrogenase [Gemmatimonadetes bacterium]|nr:pyrroloquinoline quinone-dependent dehydrogenase [Gemmatimonadota bacterium]